MEQKLFFPALVLFVLFLGPVYAETYNTATISRIDIPRFARAGGNITVAAEVFVDNPSYVNASLIVDGKLVDANIVYIEESGIIEFNYMPNSAGRKKFIVIAEVFGGSGELSKAIFVYDIAPSAVIIIVLLGAGALVYYYFYYKKWVARTEPEEFKQRGESKT